MEKLKILEMNTERTWRGGERHTYYTVEAFKDIGIEVEALVRKGSPLSEKCKRLGIRVYEVKNNLEVLLFLLKKGKDYHILHTQTPKTQSIAILTKPFHRRPIVCTRLVDFKPKGILSLTKYKLTDRVVAINKSIEMVMKDIGVRHVDIIPIMYKPRNPNKKRAIEFLKTRNIEIRKRKIVASVSALTDQKDPITLVRAIKILSDLRKDFIFLHFGDGFLLEEVRKEIKKLKIEKVYQLLGFVDDPEDFYPLFNVYVMTSLNEGTPLSILDAFYNKVPVVATDIPPLKELLQGRGLLCTVRDAECIARNIDKLLSDQILREEIVRRAYKWISETFSPESLAKEYIKIFKELL